MINYSSFRVVPSLPKQLEGLRDIAMNFRWCWDKDAIELFQRMDQTLWQQTHQNPLRMLGMVDQRILEELAADDSYLAHLQRILVRQATYMQNKATWYLVNHNKNVTVAYFSAEYGLVESLPIYSGGLGILSGDHLKAASDLGVPLIAVGLAYRLGYFQQYLNNDGWQLEQNPENDFYNMAVEVVRDDKGTPVEVEVSTPDGPCYAQIWKTLVGRITLYLLDTNIKKNSQMMRDVTNLLYVGDRESRIRQELLLGVGGVRMLKQLDIKPDVFHMNEGHSAFLALERMRSLMQEQGLNYEEAKSAVSGGNVFTTHTPVPAGNEIFENDLVWKYMHETANALGLDRERFLGLGRQDPRDTSEPFCMTVLALRCADHCNGVSKLHGVVSRSMWKETWPGLPDAEVPITSITNGIHTKTWISQELCELFDRYLGPKWVADPSDTSIWNRIDEIPDSELWRTHERRRERMVSFVRRKLRQQLKRMGAPTPEVQRAEEVLDPEALTIGFARRFATYKRATLLFRDLERLAKIVGDEERPVQIIISGKAHPADNQGKDMIRQIVHICRETPFRGRVVFLQNYDMEKARYLVQGVDVWLNTPRRPLEASGTSGMKAAANGGLNMSIPDGWWEEAYNGQNGFNIGEGENFDDYHYQDEVESKIIYDLLEQEVIPAFYDRVRDKLPRTWIKMMKNNLKTNAPNFSAQRMVKEYTEMCYLPAAARTKLLTSEKFERTRQLVHWKKNLVKGWNHIKVLHIDAEINGQCPVGSSIPIEAQLELGKVTPDSLQVEVYYGVLDSEGHLTQPVASPLKAGEVVDGKCVFKGEMVCKITGKFGYAVRVLPKHEDLSTHNMPGFIHWGVG